MRPKQLNIKNITHYFYNGFINVLNFEAINLKLDKKTWKDIDIYCIDKKAIMASKYCKSFIFDS